MNDLGRYTKVERSQHINQTDPRIYGQSYVANMSSVDGRLAFLNEPSQHDYIDYFQSFAKSREKDLPSRLPADKKDAIPRDSQLLEFEINVRRLKEGSGTASQIKVVRIRTQTKARGLGLRPEYSNSSPNEPRHAEPHQVTCDGEMAEATYRRSPVPVRSPVVNSIPGCL